MSWSMLTVVAALCLASHLSMSFGQALEQQDAQWSEATDALTPSRVTAETRQPSAGSDGRQSLSQLAVMDGGDTTPNTWNATTAASLDVAPAAPEHLFLKGDGQRDIVTTHPEDIVTTPSEDSVTTHPEDIVTTPPEDTVTTHPEDSFTTSQDNILTTPKGNVASMSEGTDDLILTPILEDGRVPTRVRQLVICSCPLPTPDACRRFLNDLYIDGKDEDYLDIRKPVATLSVAVHNVTCEKEDHRFMNFSEGQFFLRDRGDLVLRNVGCLEGLRVSDYCAYPRKNKHGYIEWTIKVCVPPPSVPRCCNPGQALRDGKCEEAANTLTLLQPPMSTGLGEQPIYWPIMKNHHHPITCTSDRLTAIPLVPDESYLLAVPTGLTHIWNPSDGHIIRKFTYPPDICVDGHVEASGSVHYTVNFCYTHPEELHHRVCDGHTCVRKCCPDDEEMSLPLNRCIPTDAKTYKPNFRKPPDDYKIVHGLPLCESQTLISEHILNSRGQLYYNGANLSAREYCVDKFNNSTGRVFDMAKVCIKEPTGWTKRRQEALFVCRIISILFLKLTVGCYCVVPELLKGRGWYQLFHVLSLLLAYDNIWTQDMFNGGWTTVTCLAMGLFLQFGFLATFFWLNVLFFDTWRKIRSLNNFIPASDVPMWAYVLYAFGVPGAIGVLTVCMQFFAPEDVPGVVKPSIAKTRCFFEHRLPRFVYFYGPIAFLFICNIAFTTHTFWTLRKFEQNASILKKNSAKNTAMAKKITEQIHRKRDYVSDFKQQFSLLVLMSSCWIAEVLSWLIPPPELWILTDLLNSLQGFFIFVIFVVANRTKRKHLKRKFPLPFKMAHRLGEAAHQCCCQGTAVSCISRVSSFASQISKKLSSSSVVSNLSTLSTSTKFPESSSVAVTLSDDQNVKKPPVVELECGVVTLPHSSVPNMPCVSLHENGDTQYYLLTVC